MGRAPMPCQALQCTNICRTGKIREQRVHGCPCSLGKAQGDSWLCPLRVPVGSIPEALSHLGAPGRRLTLLGKQRNPLGQNSPTKLLSQVSVRAEPPGDAEVTLELGAAEEHNVQALVIAQWGFISLFPKRAKAKS